MSTRQVILDGGSPWGFRIHGGSDIGLPLKISRVNPGSKAALKGVREGDVISSINGTSTKDLDNSTAHSLLRSAGQHLHLSLNEDGLSSPRRRIKQTSTTTSVFIEKKTPAGEVISRRIEVKKLENGESRAATEKVKAEVHAEQSKGSSKENEKMPKKNNKKPKVLLDAKASDDCENDDDGKSGGKDQANSVPEKPEKTGLCLSLDKKLKLQIKKQKKKQKKKEFEAGKRKIPEEVSMVPEIEWEVAEELEHPEEAKAELVEPAVRISQVQVLDDANVNLNSSEMSEEEEKCLCEFLRTLEIIDGQTARQKSEQKEVEPHKSRLQIETIPEDLFEEFIENEEMVQTREAIRAFPRTSPRVSPRVSPRSSPKHSPKPRRREPDPPVAGAGSPSTVLFNYFGASYSEPHVSGEEPRIVVVGPDGDAYPNRRLDVIIEESSDFSDASGHSEKGRRTRGGENTRKTVVVDDGAIGEPCTVQPVLVETLKMSEDVVKIELAESESEGDFEVTKSETTNGEVEIYNSGDDRSECAKSKDKKISFMSDKDDCSDNSRWSIKSLSSASVRLMEDEGSESWRSSLNPELGDGAEADVESELDSQKAVGVGDAGDDLSLKRPDLLESDEGDGIKIFISDFKKDKATESDLSRSWSSLNNLPVYEVNAEGLFQKKFLSAIRDKEKEPCWKEEGTAAGDDVPVTEQDGPVRTRVSVRETAEAIKNDMDKILMTKLKVMKRCGEPRFSEASWVGVLEETKKQSNRTSGDSSDSSSYENVSPSRPKTTNSWKAASKDPEALSNLAEKKVLTLPYGRLVLKKIGLGSCCSDNSCNAKDDEVYLKSGDVSPDLRLGIEEEGPRRNYIEFDYSNPRIGETEKWYGMRTAVPAVLVGLSPSQKKVYEEQQKRFWPEEAEAASLLDLHQKFLQRRSYHEANCWSRERNLVFDSKTMPVSITEMSGKNKVLGTENKKWSNAEKGKGERRVAKGNVQSGSRVGGAPGSPITRSVGNGESEKKAGPLKPKTLDERGNKSEGRGGGGKTRSDEESGAVGKSRLLAILQNATSDEFVPELNPDFSIKCSGENHEVSLVRNQGTMTEKAFGPTSSGRQGSRPDGERTFQDFWSKEKKYCSPKGEGGGRQNFRPKTICCGDESGLYINELKFVKEIRSPRKAALGSEEEKEELVVTENLPAVSDVIKSFEKPRMRQPARESSDGACKRTQIQIDNERYEISRKGDIALIQGDLSERRKIQKEKRKSMPASILSEKEIFKQKMYDEYMSKLAERIERRQQKVIKVSQSNEIECPEDSKFLVLENEFISKVKERKEKLGEGGGEGRGAESLEKKCQEFASYWAGETSILENGDAGPGDGGGESSPSKRSSVQLLLDPTADVDSLPRHLKELLQVEGDEFPDFLQDPRKKRIGRKVEECGRCRAGKNSLLREIDEELVLSKGFLFARGKYSENMPSSVMFSPTFKATAPRPGVWSPARQASEEKTEVREENEERKKLEDEPIPPVWTPKSAQASPVLERKEFRPVNFESPTLPRKKYIQDDKRESSVPPPWQQPGGDRPPELAKSPSSPALSLPKAPNPTVTLLQKAREGHLPRGARYLNSEMNEFSPASQETSIERLEIVSSSRTESDRPRKIEVGPKKIIGIGPTTKEGIPLVLRSEVTDENKEKWYKRMYDSLHKYGTDDDFVTVKYRTSPSRKGLYGYHQGSSSGYQSEPESLTYDRSANKYVTLDRRRSEKSKENECISVTLPRSRASPPRRDFTNYKNQPGRIENYEPGRSSISELEANKWWDEVLEIFDRWLDRSPDGRDAASSKLLLGAVHSRREEEKSRPIQKPQSPRSFTNYASGYISDPQYVYKRSEDEVQSPPNSEEQKEAYRIIQKGGEIPLRGLRKPAPERPKEEIEYFPLSPTLTRIRVHKQNITPLSELPFYLHPVSRQHTTLNYPTLPFGVCSSFSQVQIFPPLLPLPSQLPIAGAAGPAAAAPKTSDSSQKFSVQLQNISGPDDYVRIVPRPRTQAKKSPIYANIPVRPRTPPETPSHRDPGSPVGSRRATPTAAGARKAIEKSSGFATFSDLKRIVPSINSGSIFSRIPEKVGEKKTEKAKGTLRKRETLISKVSTKARSKEANLPIKEKAPADKTQKKERRKVLTIKGEAGKKLKKATKGKVPLSESVQREKPLSRSNKRLKSLSENLKRKKTEPKRSPTKGSSVVSDATEEDIIEYLSRFVEYESETSYLDLKGKEEVKEKESFEESEDVSMSPIYESVEPKLKVESDMTEVFRSRSFSPDVKRKMFKLPDMNKPIPPKRKQSKNSPTLKMWSKMMVTYPNRRSRLDAFDSNVKFLGDRIKRKLADDKEEKAEFGDDIETVRTVRKDENGAMSIKTNRYVRLTRPASSGSLSARSTYPGPERRRLASESRTKIPLTELTKSRKLGEASTVTKIGGSSDLKKTGSKQKDVDAFVKSSTTYSLRNPTRQEEDKRKSVKVTVAISSKGKELLRKTAGVASPPKRASKSSSSPCPSFSSYRSEFSAKSPSEKGSASSRDRLQSPPTRYVSPNSSVSRLSSPSRSTSPGSAVAGQKTISDPKPTPKKPSALPIMATYGEAKGKPDTKTVASKTKTPTVTKFPGKRLLTQMSTFGKLGTSKEEIKKKVKKTGKPEPVPTGRFKKNEMSKKKAAVGKAKTGSGEGEKNEVAEGRDLVRTDSFFQNLFLRSPPGQKPAVSIERISSVLERARRYQRRINWPETYKSEPSIPLVTFYLNQKRPVSFSRFKNVDREWSPSRSQSPLGSLHSETFQMKLRRFDSMSQFGDGLCRDLSPEGKERSSSEPPLHRSRTNSPEEKFSRVSLSELSSARSSPNSSRSPSCRRIQSFKSYGKAGDSGGRELKKLGSRARSAGEIEEMKSRPGLQYGDLGKSLSSLNLSNASDHTEYQAYVLELMHSTRKCERFRELHKFYSNLERMGKLEKTASTGDLRPRLRNEEIIDFDRWKKVRAKERAEAELKTLVDSLVRVQKEKDLLFRASDVEAVRWKGDRGLRIKERSVEDLKEQFKRYSQEPLDQSGTWKRESDGRKDHYKPLWRGSSILDVATNLSSPLISHRGRPITLEELEKIENANARIGKEYGYSLKAWSTLSNEQVDALKDQLTEIYAQDARRKAFDLPDNYEISVPKGGGIKSPGESSLHVRCNSALSRSQTFTPTVKRKEEARQAWKKAESVSALPSWKPESEELISLPQLPWKADDPGTRKLMRSQSETRSARGDRYPVLRSKSSSSSKPLSEHEKKRLSMTLSREVIEKMTKASGKGPLFPRETLGALAAAGSKLRDRSAGIRNWTEAEDKANELRALGKGVPTAEMESGSGSSETSVKTVIRKNSTDVLRKVQYFEELQQSTERICDSGSKDEPFKETATRGDSGGGVEDDAGKKLDIDDPGATERRSSAKMKKEKKKSVLVPSSSLENLNDYFGQQKQYATSSLQSRPAKKQSKAQIMSAPKVSPDQDFYELRNAFDDKKWAAVRYRSASPFALPSGSSNESLFSYRSRSVSPDPTKYYRAYLKMVKCGAVRRLCNKFESWEDLLSLSSDKDFWLPPPPRRFASDPELTRDLLRRFGTDPTKVTIRGQEVGDVRWLRTKFEKDFYPVRGRSRFRRARSPLVRSPLTVADRFMPRINVISKTAELQMQGLSPDSKKEAVLAKLDDLAAPPESYRSLIDYTKDHGGYYYTGEVEKLKRKFERLEEAERLSILGQMYTSAPNVNELRDIAPYLECSWIAHRYPRVTKTASSPELQTRRPETSKKSQPKPRPRSSSPVRPKQPSSILKPSYPHPDRFADQKFDPSIHRPKYRYQPEREADRRYRRGDPDWWRHWTKPTVTFKESVSFKIEPEVLDFNLDSPRKYVESEVTIHYKSPVRSEAKAMLSEDELARRQAESMKRIYKEERRRKYLQELQDMNSRRHTDNFTPSQKSPISLNRYDDFPLDPTAFHPRARDYAADSVLVARGLYDFVGKRPRELAFRRGDVIFIIRKLDKNWCEGELNGVVGLFPLSYVEVMPYNEINLKFGRARAKYDFVPQTSMELSARKGDMITLIRKIDENWFEGRIGDRTGIIPGSYCHILAMPQAGRVALRAEKLAKPVAAPAAHSLIHNGSGLSSKHYYTPYLSPNSPGRSTASSTSATFHDGHPSADMLIDEALMQLDEEFDLKRSASKSASQPLNVRVNPRPDPALYQVLFNHVPNNDDELELIQGETVTVVEKCGDGWYIGSKTSDGKLGIFPGTHVRRIAPEFV